MNVKSILLAGALACGGLLLASTKSYTIWLDTPTKAGPVELVAGQYKVQVEGSNALLKNQDNGKSYTIPVKVETAAHKYEQSAVVTTKKGDSTLLDSIQLGGSTTKIEPGK